MTQFLKNHAKLFYLIFGIFSFFFIVAACFYITAYNDTAVNYNVEVLNGTTPYMATGNEYLVSFCAEVRKPAVGAPDAYKFSEMYQALFQFNRSLQKANNLYLALGVVSLVMLACMLICSNHSRKKFYISNLVSGVVCPSVSIILGIVALVFNFIPLGSLSGDSYTQINWGALANNTNWKEVVELYKVGDTSQFSINSSSIIIYGVFIILFIIVAGLLLAYNVFRYKMTQEELKNTAKVVEQNA